MNKNLSEIQQLVEDSDYLLAPPPLVFWKLNSR